MASFGAAAFFILISCSYVSSQDYYEQTVTSRGPDRNRLRDPVFILKSYLLGVLEVKCQHKLSIEAIEKPVLTAETCIKSEVNFEKLSQEYDKAAKNRTLSKFFVEQCSFIPTIRKCTKPVISAVSECFNRDDQLELKKFFDLVDNINTFACENDGDRIKQFFDNKGDECIFNSLIPDRFIVIYEITNRVASISDENYCIGLGPLRRSFREEMENCTSKVPYQLLDQSMDMVTGTLCSSSSTIFWFSFKNLILLLAIYLYSKMY